MIGHLTGTVLFIHGNQATVDVHGVGYEVRCTERCRAKLAEGIVAKIPCYHEVREDGQFLYGFVDLVERQVFSLLLRVKGVGARTASDILSTVDARELLRKIGAQDVVGLKAIKGVGQKTAERIVLELRDKVASLVGDVQLEVHRIPGGSSGEALEALIALGFTRADGERAIKAALGSAPQNLSTGDLVREALRHV